MRSFECYEKVNLQNLGTLLTRVEDCGQRELLQKLYAAALKNADPEWKYGALKVTYTETSKELGGRWYAKGPTLQRVRKDYRQIICAPSWDFDIVNAHPVLLRNLCDRFKIPCPNLTCYINNRDIWLTGEDAVEKGDILASIYGSQASSDHILVQALRKEMIAIAEKLTPRYADLEKALKKKYPSDNEAAIERSLMSFILQREETKVVSMVLTLMQQQFPDLEIQAYIYDGFMVRKADGVDSNQVLCKINEWVQPLRVQFALKPFECPADFEPEPVERLRGGDHDVNAFNALCLQFPDFVKRADNVNMVFDRATGIWQQNSFGSFANLLKEAHANNEYGQNVRAMERVWKLMATLPDDAAYFEAARLKAKGKLLFKDGIWDKLEGERLDFSPSIFFAHAVPHNIPLEKPDAVDEVNKFHFDHPYPEPGVAEWRRQVIVRAAFGLGADTMTFELGAGANGKSVRVTALSRALGNKLVISLDGRHFTVDKYNNSAGASPHLMKLKHARMVFVNDPPKDSVLDMALLKKLTGMDPIAARGLYKDLEEFISYAMVQLNVNNMPRFSECEESYMERRVRFLSSNVRYVIGLEKDDPENHVYRADEAHTSRMIAATDALLWILINEPLRDVPVPESVKHETKDLIAEKDELKSKFHQLFTKDNDGKVASDELGKELSLNPRDLSKRMSTWGFGKPKTMRIPGRAGTVNGYVGLRRKRPREDEEDVDGEHLGGSGEDQVPAGAHTN